MHNKKIILKNTEVYNTDGWIYINNIKHKKYFNYTSNNGQSLRIWPGKLVDIKKLEAKRWKIYNWKDKFVNEEYLIIFDNIYKGNGCYGYVYDKIIKKRSKLFLEVTQHDQKKWISQHYAWHLGCSKTDEYYRRKQERLLSLPENQNLINKWLYINKKSRNIGLLYSNYNKLFDTAIYDYISKDKKRDNDCNHIIIINNRKYIYDNNYSIFSYPENLVDIEL